MVYNVAAKMTIFKNLKHINTGIEIVPVKALADEMSSGVSYFEQFVWDLEQRGISDIDIPVNVHRHHADCHPVFNDFNEPLNHVGLSITPKSVHILQN